MNNFLATAVLNAMWQIPILTAAGWLTARTLRRAGPAVEHGIWTGVLVLSLLLPLLPARHLNLQKSKQNTSAHGVSISLLTPEQGSLHDAGLIRLPLAAVNILCGLWALTIVSGASRLAVGLVRTRRLLAKATPCAIDDDLQGVWQECCELMRVGSVGLYSSEEVCGPVTLTSDANAVVLPFGFSQEVGREELRAALLHECAHVSRRDFRNNLFYQTLALPVQFHPAIWFVKQQLAASREMACDAAVVHATGDGFAYGERLLRLATWMSSRVQASTTHAVGMFDANILEERIMRISSCKPVLASAARVALMGVSACVLTVGVASAMASGIEVVTPANGAQAIYTVGKDATAPQLTFQVDPQYTQAAREAKVSGECIVAAVVDAKGVPQDVHVTKGLRPDLDANAIAAVKQYRFRPGLHNGKPVQVQLSVAVNFQIF